MELFFRIFSDGQRPTVHCLLLCADGRIEQRRSHGKVTQLPPSHVGFSNLPRNLHAHAIAFRSAAIVSLDASAVDTPTRLMKLLLYLPTTLTRVTAENKPHGNLDSGRPWVSSLVEETKRGARSPLRGFGYCSASRRTPGSRLRKAARRTFLETRPPADYSTCLGNDWLEMNPGRSRAEAGCRRLEPPGPGFFRQRSSACCPARRAPRRDLRSCLRRRVAARHTGIRRPLPRLAREAPPVRNRIRGSRLHPVPPGPRRHGIRERASHRSPPCPGRRHRPHRRRAIRLRPGSRPRRSGRQLRPPLRRGTLLARSLTSPRTRNS